MKQKSIGKNYIFNLILMMVNILFPLITAPYLSNILGAENIGKVNYATSIINWFILIASFGIPRYGVREVARNRECKRKLSDCFWNLLIIQIILSMISILGYIYLINTVEVFNNDKNLYLIMILMIILNIFSIDWFYQGIEEYGYITIRNIIVKIVSIFLIFIMIKDEKQYILYAIINILGLGFNNIFNYIHVKKYIYKKNIDLKIWSYIKELRIYFFTTFIVALYTQLDQTFIGYLSQRDLALYIRSKTIQGIGFNITNSIIIVLIPRVSYLIVKDYNKYKEVIKESINYIYILAIPAMFGMCILSKEIMYVLGGSEFINGSLCLQIMSFIILILSLGTWQINQILIPNKKEKEAFYFQCVASVFSICLNMLLIPNFSYIGAAITWLTTEVLLLILVAIYIRIKLSDIRVRYFNFTMAKYFIASIIMGISILFLKQFIKSKLLVLVFTIPIGIIVYFITLIILRDDLILKCIKNIYCKVK